MARRMPWKTSIFLRGRFELLTGGWVSWCWVPKRDDTVERTNDAWVALNQEKNDWKTDKETEKKSVTFCIDWFDLSST